MKVNGKRAKEKVMEFRNFGMVKFMKDHGIMIKWMEKEF